MSTAAVANTPAPIIPRAAPLKRRVVSGDVSDDDSAACNKRQRLCKKRVHFQHTLQVISFAKITEDNKTNIWYSKDEFRQCISRDRYELQDFRPAFVQGLEYMVAASCNPNVVMNEQVAEYVSQSPLRGNEMEVLHCFGQRKRLHPAFEFRIRDASGTLRRISARRGFVSAARGRSRPGLGHNNALTLGLDDDVLRPAMAEALLHLSGTGSAAQTQGLFAVSIAHSSSLPFRRPFRRSPRERPKAARRPL